MAEEELLGFVTSHARGNFSRLDGQSATSVFSVRVYPFNKNCDTLIGKQVGIGIAPDCFEAQDSSTRENTKKNSRALICGSNQSE